MQSPSRYSCPICRLPLASGEGTFRCDNNHGFDTAKEGYVNLLPAQHKGSKQPGDSKEMVMARRAFLVTGHYRFLLDAVIQAIDLNTAEGNVLIDAGCGEGYYTNAIAGQLPKIDVYGMDIAKTAVRYAAKRSNNVHYAVASSHKMPFKDNAAKMISKVFAPVDFKEVTRVLKADGLLLSVVPGPRHLFELKQLIYQNPRLHAPEQSPPGFTSIASDHHNQKITLTQKDDIANLAQMTPFAWKMPDEQKRRLSEVGEFEITFDFVLNLYRRARN